MNSKPLSWFLRAFIALFFIIFIFLIWQINHWQFAEFLSWANQQVADESLINKVQSILTKKNFSLLQTASLISILPIVGLLILYYFKEKKIVRSITSLYQLFNTQTRARIKHLIGLSLAERVVLFTISVLFLVKAYWYVFNWPMQYDEAWTFNHFIKGSWFVTLFAPHNNHIFYTIIAKIFAAIFFFLRPIEAIRLPLPLFAFGSAWLLYFFIDELFNKRVALLSFGIFLGIGPVVFYSLYARAYMLGIFFSILFLTQLYSLSKQRTISNQFWLIVSGILAVYSIQSSIFFLLPVWVFGFFIILRQKGRIRNYLLLSVLLFIGIVAVYAPILVTTKMALAC